MSNELITQTKILYTDTVISKIKELLNNSRNNIAIHVNNELLSTYWKIGDFFIFNIQFARHCLAN